MADTSVTFTATSQRWSTLTNADGGTNGVKRVSRGSDDAGRISISVQGTLTNGSVLAFVRRPLGQTTWREIITITSANVPLEDDITELAADWEYDLTCKTFVAGDAPVGDLR